MDASLFTGPVVIEWTPKSSPALKSQPSDETLPEFWLPTEGSRSVEIISCKQCAHSVSPKHDMVTQTDRIFWRCCVGTIAPTIR